MSEKNFPRNPDLQTLQFTVLINASREHVWNTMLEDKTYRLWTSVFAPDSYAETDWQEGSKALFLDGKGSGMVSTIAVNKRHEFLSIKHLGVIKDGVEDLGSEAVKAWAGALENYTFKSRDGFTELTIDMDINEDYKQFFLDAWPKALQKLKKIAEETAVRKIFVNLPVKDLTKAMKFFEALGFQFNPQWTDATAACMVITNDIYAMLLTHEKFKGFTPNMICDAKEASEVLLALTCRSRNEVDELVQKAVAAGGNTYHEPTDYGFMYSHGFQDLDGHIWEVLAMEPSTIA